MMKQVKKSNKNKRIDKIMSIPTSDVWKSWHEIIKFSYHNINNHVHTTYKNNKYNINEYFTIFEIYKYVIMLTSNKLRK